MRNRLEMKGISRSFDDGGAQRMILCDLDLQVKAGEFVAVMGPSGSGKSTFLSIAGALLAPSGGSIEVDGEPIVGLDQTGLADLRLRKLGFIFQSSNLIPYLKVAEQLELVAKLAGVKGREAEERSEDLLERLGLQHRRQAYPEKLSGGERQRVAIARALMNDPAVILADEPTASLDGLRGLAVVEMIALEVRTQGKSAVMVTHDERVLPACDRVLWLENGRLVAR
ncbi:ABC transporter ATP-binding protein [Paenibacillus oryzisoli]|uniref:ABC transporter ATP-binding protein n=1 Tax=Paenibacillus oryzisoli TaxID=1850517 RepID=UPI003D2B8225